MNPYEILGVDKSATKQQIRKAYLKLAKKHHPDKGGSKEEFQKIQAAYEILMDGDKRHKYDTTGDVREEKSIDIQFLQFVYTQISILIQTKIYSDTNVVSEVRKITHQMILGCEEAIHLIQKQINTCRELKDKFFKDGDGENVFILSLDNKINELERGIVHNNQQIQQYQEFFRMLKDYQYGSEYKAPPPPVDLKKQTQDYADSLYADLTSGRNINMAEVRRHLDNCSKEYRYDISEGIITVSHIMSGETAKTNFIQIH